LAVRCEDSVVGAAHAFRAHEAVPFGAVLVTTSSLSSVLFCSVRKLTVLCTLATINHVGIGRHVSVPR
jgi:hypothetical protein